MEYWIIALVLLLDQASKYYIQVTESLHGEMEIIPGFFYITYVKNDGAAWNMLAGRQIFLSLIAVAAIAVMSWYLVKKISRSARLQRVALSLMIAGAAGNLIDRVLLHFVRDFLHFYPFGYDFPVFNIADSALCIGVGLLIIDAFLEEKKA
jgi:signal peptidase II